MEEILKGIQKELDTTNLILSRLIFLSFHIFRPALKADYAGHIKVGNILGWRKKKVPCQKACPSKWMKLERFWMRYRDFYLK